MKKSIIYILLVFLSIGVLKAAETDAIFKKIRKEHIMHTDGSIEFKYYKEITYLTPYAFNRLYGETFVVYNPDFQELVVHQAYTIMKNGRKVSVPENAYNIVLPRAVANYPAYNQMHEMVITHTGLEVGATVYLEYSVISKPGFLKEMMGTEILSEGVPVDQYELVLKVPARRGVFYRLLNSENKAEESNDGTYRILKWSFKNVSQRAYEQAAPASYDLAPTLCFSTFADIPSAFVSFEAQKAFDDQLPSDLLKKVNQWKKEAKSKLGLALSIQTYIANNISSKHFPLSWSNYEIQTPTQVWNANIGNDLEKTALLSKTLQAAGFDVKIIGFMSETLWHTRRADLANVEAWGVVLSIAEMKEVILSASHVNKKSMEFEHPSSIILDLKTGKPIELSKANDAIHVNAKITIDPENQIFGESTFKLSGSMFDALKLMQDTQSIQRYFIHGLPLDKESKIEALYSDAQNAKFTLAINGDAKLKKQENYYFWNLPQMNNGIAAKRFNELPSLREFPLMVDAIEESYEYVITLPKSVEWIGQEVHIAYEENFGKMSIDVMRKEGNIVIKKSLTISPKVMKMMAPKGPMTVHSEEIIIHQYQLTLEEYAVFRQMMIDWNSERANELVLKR